MSKLQKGLFMKKVILLLLIISIVLLLGYSCYNAWVLWSSYKQGQDSYNNISNEYTEEVQNNNIDTPKTDSPNVNNEINQFDQIIIEEVCPISVDFERLQSVNQDCIGWIYSCDEKSLINYPIVQSKNNYYYIDKLFDKTSNRAGSIFMDYQNSSDFSDYNTIIYGHCMNDKSMFGTLKQYMSQAYYERFPHLYLLTPTQNYKLVIIAAFTTELTNKEDYDIFITYEEFQKHVKSIMEKSILDTGANIDTIDRIVTLSTCSNEFGGARWLVICQPVPIK